jgi:hypothetical protein
MKKAVGSAILKVLIKKENQPICTMEKNKFYGDGNL